ncbi:GNAT family N-acetyltransferase [Vibrio profundum]|uniref:GNAT family N-acetyltransferase n=1 Tax=Vibrio profundum TaxID=2910247 RepID=UPI003D0DA499
MYSIRQAKQEDINRIAEIEQRCFSQPEAATLESFQQRFSTFPDCFFILEVNGVIAGHINGCIFDKPELPDDLYSNPSRHCPDGSYQTVFGLAVDPAFQRRGYAQQLLQHFIEFSKSKHQLGIILTCKKTLIGFYQSYGFVYSGESASNHGGERWNDMLLIH